MYSADVVARLGVVGLLLEPLGERDFVECSGVRVIPRTVGIHLRGQVVESVRQRIDGGVRDVGHRHGIAGESQRIALSVDVEHVALAIAGIRLQPELIDDCAQRRLVGRDPLAADLEVGVAVPFGAQAATDPVAGLEDEDVLACLRRGARRRSGPLRRRR